MRSTRTRLLALGSLVLLAAVVLQVRSQYSAGRRGERLSTGLPAEGIADNDTHGKVPGDPRKAFADARELIRQIGVYKQFHQGAYPDSTGALEADRVNNYKRYGYARQRDALTPFANPDSKYDDNAAFRKRAPNNIFVIQGTRPDGVRVGAAKSPGTRDALGFTTLYLHLNIRHYNGSKDTINPTGFFIVLWDDGSVGKVPYSDLRFVKQPGTRKYVWGFKGEAGVPEDATTFDQW